MVNKIKSFFNYINPYSKTHTALTDYKNLPKTRYKVAAIAAAIFASIIPIAGTTAAFRSVVHHYTRPITNAKGMPGAIDPPWAKKK